MGKMTLRILGTVVIVVLCIIHIAVQVARYNEYVTSFPLRSSVIGTVIFYTLILLVFWLITKFIR